MTARGGVHAFNVRIRRLCCIEQYRLFVGGGRVLY
jgi:hypothetical protein